MSIVVYKSNINVIIKIVIWLLVWRCELKNYTCMSDGTGSEGNYVGLMWGISLMGQGVNEIEWVRLT